jgi:hypothetical protein
VSKQSPELLRKKTYKRPAVIYAGVLSVCAGLSVLGGPKSTDPNSPANPFDPANLFGK